jgi:hypothetical protein
MAHEEKEKEMTLDFETKFGLSIIGAWLTVGGISLAGWVTHIVVCIQNEQWILLIAGAIAAPIGVVHGIGQWFGAW